MSNNPVYVYDQRKAVVLVLPVLLIVSAFWIWFLVLADLGLFTFLLDLIPAYILLGLSIAILLKLRERRGYYFYSDRLRVVKFWGAPPIEIPYADMELGPLRYVSPQRGLPYYAFELTPRKKIVSLEAGGSKSFSFQNRNIRGSKFVKLYDWLKSRV